jgi:hypothetical protein
MSDTQERQARATGGSSTARNHHEPTAWVGLLYFAGTMAILLGGFHATEGFVALFRDNYYAVTRNGLLVTMDYTAWGWTHLLIGLVAIVTGVGIFAGQMWARVLGIVIAVISALASMAFLPAYPVWCTIVIAMDILVIYALTVHGREPAYA